MPRIATLETTPGGPERAWRVYRGASNDHRNREELVIQTHRYAEGTRVQVQRGTFPMDDRLVGRKGLIVEVDPYQPERYGVQLDDEEEVRDFHDSELLVLTDEAKPEHDQGSPGPGIR